MLDRVSTSIFSTHNRYRKGVLFHQALTGFPSFFFDKVRYVKTCIFIVASGSREIGTGHLSRQFELACLAMSRGFEVFLFGHYSPSWLARFKGAGVNCVPGPLFPESWQTLKKTRELELNPETTWIIRDNYGLRPEFSQEVSQQFGHFVHFDDLPTIGATYEILVNPGISRDSYDSDADHILNSGTALLGASSSIIRMELRKLRYSASPGKLNRLSRGLVSFGFSDPTDATTALWDCIPRSPDLDWKFLLGPDYSGGLKTERVDGGKSTFMLKGLLGKEYFDFRLGIGSGGVSAFERAFCGVPSLNFAILANQKGVSFILESEGAALALEHISAEGVQKAIERLSERDAWNTFREAGMELVDGRGGDRLLDMITERSL